jgi:hypothetical protein
LIFLTHFFKGGSTRSNAKYKPLNSPGAQARPRAARKSDRTALVSDSWWAGASPIFLPVVAFSASLLCGRQKRRKKIRKYRLVVFIKVLQIQLDTRFVRQE